MNPTNWFDTAVCTRLILTLGHFVWQGALIYLLAIAAARLLRQASAASRYGLLTAALLLMAACPPLTYLATAGTATPDRSTGDRSTGFQPVSSIRASDAAEEHTPRSRMPALPIESGNPAELPPLSLATDNEPPTIDSPQQTTHNSQQTSKSPSPDARFLASLSHMLTAYAPHAVIAYSLGAAAMLTRLFLALYGGQRLRRRSQPLDNPAILTALQRQARAIGLHFIPAIAYCRSVCVPTVIGVLRPMILLPLTFTTGLTAEQIEAILTHELAHIRRYDHLVNLLQRLIEAFLFFHPAVWLLSRRIRLEREHACDDLVLAAGAAPLAYADSLLRMAELSRVGSAHQGGQTPPYTTEATLAATGHASQLRTRILRLIGAPGSQRVRLRKTWLLALSILLLAAVMLNRLFGPSSRYAEMSKWTQSAQQLKAVGIALYSREGGQPPPNLQTLLDEKLLQSDLLISPLARTTTQPSYLYIRPGSGHDARNVIAFENPAHFNGNQTIVLYSDGHADLMNIAGFRQVLSETFQRLNRPMPAELTQKAIDATLQVESATMPARVYRDLVVSRLSPEEAKSLAEFRSIKKALDEDAKIAPYDAGDYSLMRASDFLNASQLAAELLQPPADASDAERERYNAVTLLPAPPPASAPADRSDQSATAPSPAKSKSGIPTSQAATEDMWHEIRRRRAGSEVMKFREPPVTQPASVISTRVYDVGDLLDKARGFLKQNRQNRTDEQLEQQTARELEDLIKSLIQPGTWEKDGENDTAKIGSIQAWNDRIIVRHNAAAHSEVAKLIENLRKSKGATQPAGTQPATGQSNQSNAATQPAAAWTTQPPRWQVSDERPIRVPAPADIPNNPKLANLTIRFDIPGAEEIGEFYFGRDRVDTSVTKPVLIPTEPKTHSSTSHRATMSSST